MEGTYRTNLHTSTRAWTRYKSNIQHYITAVEDFKDNIAHFRHDTIGYIKQVWYAARVRHVQATWSDLDAQLEGIITDSPQVQKTFDPNSDVLIELRCEISALKASVMSLKKLHMRCILNSVIIQYSDDQLKPKYQIERAKQIGCLDSALQNESLNKMYQDAYTGKWIRFPVGIKDDQGEVQYYCAKQLKAQLKETPPDKPFRLHHKHSAPLSVQDLCLIQSGHTYFKTLNNLLVNGLVNSVLVQFQGMPRCQPQYQIELAKAEGLPDSAFQDSTLRKEYTDPLTGKWIRYPVGIKDDQGELQYYCAEQLKAQLANPSKSNYYRLNSGAESLAFKDFVFIKSDDDYFGRLFNHLNALKVHLAQTKERKHNLMEVIQAAKTQFADEYDQPITLIQKAFESGQISVEQLNSTALLPFFDQTAQNWIRFPVCRTIQSQEQVIYGEYYCASTLENLLKQCADSEPLALLEEFQQASFQAVSTMEPYIKNLRWYLMKNNLHQSSHFTSMHSFFSEATSDSSMGSRIAETDQYHDTSSELSAVSSDNLYSDDAPLFTVEVRLPNYT